MTATQIFSEISRMPLIERIQVIEFTLKSIKKETSQKLRLSEAAKLLLPDYENDKELTIFTSLDYQNFYEAR